MVATSNVSDLSKEDEQLTQSVKDAHVMVATETRGDPIQNFSCRDLPLGKLTLFDISIDPIAIFRRSEDIAGDANDDYLLATQIEGTVIVTQGDAEFTQHPGSLAVMAAGEPYSIVHTQKSHRLILHIPNETFRERLLGSIPDKQFRPRLLPTGGLASVVHNILVTLAFEADKLIVTEQYTLSESLLELTSAILRSEVDREYESQHARQSALFRRILEYIEKNYTDCELSPEKIAKANGISMRYLHSLFHQAGIRVSKWMWERRLKATREDLLDPNMGQKRISEIAFNRGFNDPAHFSRAFKNRFDISPTQLRERVDQSSSLQS